MNIFTCQFSLKRNKFGMWIDIITMLAYLAMRTIINPGVALIFYIIAANYCCCYYYSMK